MRTYLSQFPYNDLFVLSCQIWILYIGYYLLKHKSYIGFRKLIISGFTVLYIVFFWQLYVRIPPCRAIGKSPYVILQMVPFHTIKHSNYISTFGNLVMLIFLPIALYLNLGSFKWTWIVSIFISVMIEPVQFLIDWMTRFPQYVVDIDDTIMQMSGCIIGLLLVSGFRQLGRHIRDAVFSMERRTP